MTTSDETVAVVLAAGQGTRMKSARPKVLHEVAARPMVVWPIEAALRAGVGRCIVVVGHGRDEVRDALGARLDAARVTTAVQAEQRGTGDAVRCAMEALDGFEGRVLVLYGDCPMVRTETLARLLGARRPGGEVLSMLTATLEDATGYGRILRDAAGRVTGVREQRDCSAEEAAIREVNPGMYAVDAAFLRDAIARLSTDNAQGELYLTDVVAMAATAGGVVDVPGDMDELSGINDRFQLAQAEAQMRLRIAERHAKAGVTVRDPSSTWIDPEVEIAADAVIEPRVTLRGACRIGAGAHIDVGCVLTDVTVAPNALLLPYSVATESAIGEAAKVGPFSHLRPGSDLGPEVHVGNFTETKKTRMARGAKANHLSYLGDGVIGERVNVGAGTIFCNYDGYQKHTTVLEEGVFIGSDSQLVAPVRIGKNAYVATGTTVTHDVPADALAIGRARQENKEGYASRLRARLEAAKKAAAKKAK